MSQPLPERKCVVCGKVQNPEFRPFCSRRCADVDLGKWLAGRYAIPAEEPPDDFPDVPKDDE